VTTAFQHDVLLSHDSADKPRVRRLAQWLRTTRLPGSNFALRTSHSALPNTAPVRDPANADHRFIPLLLADTL